MSRPEFNKAVDSKVLWEMLDKPDKFDQYVMIGSNGTGLFWHSHDCAWNVAIHGKRRWFLFSGGTDAADSKQHQDMKYNIQPYKEAGMSNWVDSGYPSLQKKTQASDIAMCTREGRHDLRSPRS